jgi:hypothetical protein
MESGTVGHNFEMGLPKDYPSQIWFNSHIIEFLINMMTINFDTITNNYEVIYVIKTVMKYHLKHKY